MPAWSPRGMEGLLKVVGRHGKKEYLGKKGPRGQDSEGKYSLTKGIACVCVCVCVYVCEMWEWEQGVMAEKKTVHQ